MATPAISLTALELRLARLTSKARAHRITSHAIDRLLAKLSVDVGGASREQVGNLLDELIQDGKSAGRAKVWLDTGGRRSEPIRLEAVQIDLDGYVSAWAVLLDNDLPDHHLPQACTTVLTLHEFERSTGADGRGMASWFTPEALAAKRAPSKPTSALAAALGPALPAIVVSPPPAPSPAAAPSAATEVVQLAGIESKGTAEKGAIIKFEDARGDHEIVCPWADVPKQIAALVDRGVVPEAIGIYRHIPFRVRTTVHVTIGD